MNNKDNYKNAIDQIHASESLKEKTIERVRKNRNSKKIVYLKFLSACAVFLLIFGLGTTYYEKAKPIGPGTSADDIPKQTKMVALNKDLPRFKNFEELKDALDSNELFFNFFDGGVSVDMAVTESATAGVEDMSMKSASREVAKSENTDDYSKTNVQVEDVDEADIVKTDGNFIYYITNNKVYLIRAGSLEIVQTIDLNKEKERFAPTELFVNKDKLIVIGIYNTITENENNSKRRYYTRNDIETMTQAVVFDISDKNNPEEVRTVRLSGAYRNSRMIGENIYLISSKGIFYYDGMKEEEVMPLVYDTNTGTKTVAVTDIAYFKDTDSYSLMTVAGFDINNNDEVCTETFFGASELVYASKDNLYITQTVMKDGIFSSNSSNIIYKFKLDGSRIELLCKGEVKGYMNSQFSMDEYDGKLRVATTYGYDEEATNQLYVFDENLKEIGKIENMAVGEKIYAVRFIGKIGYVVTFEQIDPLFVIDLSDPTNPTIKGELKIPGYSSYLHPYDETHIIGIGYNTKSNGYGGVQNANMKMSMFDVSDLENPTELFHIDIGDSYAYSDITYNHKALFEHKERSLIGFPVTLRDYKASKDRDAFAVFKVDLENNTFERYGEISHEIDYRTNIDRAIYIGNTLYTLAEYEVKSYNLDTLEELETLTIEEEFEDYLYNDDTQLVEIQPR